MTSASTNPKEAALSHKADGNKAFSAQNFEDAIKHFAAAIDSDPKNESDQHHVFFSNRSACYASLQKYEEAYLDANKCLAVVQKRDGGEASFPKVYSRKAGAEFGLKRYTEAKESYDKGLKLNPTDNAMIQGLAQVESELKKIEQAKNDPYHGLPPALLMQACQTNPKCREYMKDGELMKKFKMLISSVEQMQMESKGKGKGGAESGATGGKGGASGMDPMMLQNLLSSDSRLQEMFMALQGIKSEDSETSTSASSGYPAAKKAKTEVKKEEPDNRTDNQKKADEFKNEGNTLYKAKKFEEAIEKYDKAIETEPNDMVYYNNRAAVLIEMKRYDECEKSLKDILDKKYDMNTALSGGASFEKVGKVLNRLASVYQKQGKFADAILYYEKSLAEDNNKNTRNAIREIKLERDQAEKDAYFDDEKAEEAKGRGNEFFKNTEFSKAKLEYDEAIKRTNPKTHPQNLSKLLSNRAGAFQKLLSHPDALRDLDQSVKLDPTFVKAYSRKGYSHLFMKDFNKALKAYDAGLKIDPNDAGCKSGREEVLKKIREQSSMSSMGGGAGAGAVGSEDHQRQVNEAMKDPEIQAILKDPQMNLILKSMQEDPKAASEIMKKGDPQIMNALNKLIGAGVLKMG